MEKENTKIEVEIITANKEIACMDCLKQVMDAFNVDLTNDERFRVAAWFNAKYTSADEIRTSFNGPRNAEQRH